MTEPGFTNSPESQTEELPKLGETLEIWFEGHVAVRCVSHYEDGSIGVVLLPLEEEVIAEREDMFGDWRVVE